MPDEVEQQLRQLSDADWDALTARLRAPDAAEALRTVVSKYISGERLEAVCAVMAASAFVDSETGEVDEGRVAGLLRTMFDLPAAPAAPAGPKWQNFGQGQPPAPPVWRGDSGRAEAAKRFGGGRQPTGSSAVNAKVAKRFGKSDGRQQK